jgi:hypothetical protein
MRRGAEPEPRFQDEEVSEVASFSPPEDRKELVNGKLFP